MKHIFSKLTIAMCLALGTAACGGGSSGSSGTSTQDSSTTSSTPTESPTTKKNQTVRVVVQNYDSADYSLSSLASTNDDYKVCVDVNANLVCDGSDIYAKQKAQNEFEFELTEEQAVLNANIIAPVSDNLTYVYPLSATNANNSKVASQTSDDTTDASAVATKHYLNPVTSMVTRYSLATGETYSQALEVIASTLSVTSAELDGETNEQDVVNILARSLSLAGYTLTDENLPKFADSLAEIKKSLAAGLTPTDIVLRFNLLKDFSTGEINPKLNHSPKVNFEASVVGCRLLQFKSLAEDEDDQPLAFSWNFGDKQVTTEQNPSHSYSTTGSKRVTLRVTDGLEHVYFSEDVNVTNEACSDESVAPVFTFKNDSSNAAKVYFTNASTGDIKSYYWDFGDNSSSTSESPVHTYAKDGDYTVVLTVTDKDGNTYQKADVVQVYQVTDNLPPVVDGDLSIKDKHVSIINKSSDPDGDVLTYSWESSDGFKSTDKDFTHDFEQAGNYIVVLKVSDGKTSNSKSFKVNIADLKIEPKIEIVSVSGMTVKLKGYAANVSSDAEYTWTMGDNSQSLNGQEVEYTFMRAGKQNISLTIKDGDTTESVSIEVEVDSNNSVPVASFTATTTQNTSVFKNASTDADNDPLTYLWDFGDNTTSTEENPTHVYPVTKKTVYTVTLTVSDGKAKHTYEKQVTIEPISVNHAPVAGFLANTSTVNTAIFTNKSTDEDGDELSYLWNFGDGQTSTEKNPTHKYSVADNTSKQFTVKLTVSDGQTSTVSTNTITVKGEINCDGCDMSFADFHYSFTGLSGVLEAQVENPNEFAKYSYSWDLGDGRTLTGKKVNVSYANGGDKTITLSITGGAKTLTKTYKFTLENVNIAKPTKSGIYYKGDFDKIYIWTADETYKMTWPGEKMTTASEDSSWKFFDTSSIPSDKINVIFSGNGGQSSDIIGVDKKGCYTTSMVSLDECYLGDTSDLKKVEGGCTITPVGSDLLTNAEIGVTWGQLDYAEYTSDSTVYVDSAPYVQPNLAPGSYHTNQVVTLKLKDADRSSTTGTIYYTLDNTRPTKDSPVYNGPISLKDTSTDGLGTAYRLRTLSVGDNGMEQEQHFFWFIKTNTEVPAATDFRDETIYFVVTARYYDGDKSNNYWNRDRFDPDDPSWRGDFKGLIDQLGYIKDMGFTAIWVTPPVENRSGLDYHGYHAYDWYQPDLRLESPGATYFDFIKAAHKMGIKVIQDVVLNHSSNYGIRGQAYIEKIPTKYYIDKKFGKGKINNGPYQGNIGDYESINRCDNDNDVAPVWHRMVCAGDPNADATFSVNFKAGTYNVDGKSSPNDAENKYFWSPATNNYLPEKWYHVGYTNNWESVEEVQQRSMAGDCVDLKTENANVQDYMNGAIKMYIDMGIDAIRIDTLKHMPREDVLAMTKVWQDYKPGMFIFGEALIKGFGDNTPYALHPWYYTRTGSGQAKTGDSGVSVLDFSLMSTWRDNVTKGNVDGIASVFESFDSNYADATKLVTFFQNHDLTPDNKWSGSGAHHCCQDPINSALAYNVLWTVRGIPVMYAGDETGVRVGLPPDLTSNDDLVKDTGRIYVGDSVNNGYPIINHMKDLNAIRSASKALQRGPVKVLAGNPLVVERTYEGAVAIVAIPGTDGGSVSVSGATNGTYTDLVTGDKYTVSGGSLSISGIPGGSMRVLVKDYNGGKVAKYSKYLK